MSRIQLLLERWFPHKLPRHERPDRGSASGDLRKSMTIYFLTYECPACHGDDVNSRNLGYRMSKDARRDFFLG